MYTGNIMGKKRDLTTNEKDQIVKLLSNQKTTIEIAKMLSRDHRTIKNFVQKASKVRTRNDKGQFRLIKKKETTVLKMAIARNPLKTSRKCFNELNIQVETSVTSTCGLDPQLRQEYLHTLTADVIEVQRKSDQTSSISRLCISQVKVKRWILV